MSKFLAIASPWCRVTKGNPFARKLADRHYTRQTVGSVSFTRPGYNFCLLTEQRDALFVWWRPKWEDGRPGTSRKDGLRVVECTIFRNESTALSSHLIRSAVLALHSSYGMIDLHLHEAGPITSLITGVASSLTDRRRSRASAPGQCFIHAGWTTTNRRTQRADTWLSYPWQNPRETWSPRSKR